MTPSWTTNGYMRTNSRRLPIHPFEPCLTIQLQAQNRTNGQQTECVMHITLAALGTRLERRRLRHHDPR